MQTCLLVTMYAAGFLLQVAGVLLVLLDIRDDSETARTLAAQSESAKQITGVRRETPQATFEIGGALGEVLGQTAATTDSFAAFVHDRLSGRQSRKLLGVAFVLGGALLGLTANLIATL